MNAKSIPYPPLSNQLATRQLPLVLLILMLWQLYQVFLNPSIAHTQGGTGFAIVENFDALTPGALNGRNGWIASSTIQVSADPVSATNRVMQLGVGPIEAYKVLPSSIANTSTGTLHFRLRRDGHIDGFAGASDLATPTDWSAFETQFGAQSNRAADEFVARNGASFSVLGNGFSERTWYCVWLVSNNSNNSYEVYAKGGSFSQPTRLGASGQTTLSFRNGGTDPLRSFFTRVHQSSAGSLFIDDIYVDPSAQNLTVPGNDCVIDPPPPPPPSGFVKVDDFDNLTVGSLQGRNEWSASNGIQVVIDPASASNKALQMNVGPVEAYKALPSPIANTSTGTLHFRMRRAGHVDGFAGASDSPTPTDWAAFETQFGAQSNRAADEFVARNGATFLGLGNGFSDRTWYCVWLVTNNEANTYEVFVKGGTYAQTTSLQANLAFRNGGVDPLRTFFTRFHQSSQGALLIDDIYVDPAAQNLNTPGNACGQSSNNPPDALDDAFSVTKDSTANSLNVLANDTTLPDSNETLTIVSVTTPSQGGTATINNGVILYRPAPGFVGQEQFSYTVSDGNGGSDSALVIITVNADQNLNLSVASLEASQAIQTMNNSVPLVANRPTIVRVYLNVQGSNSPVAGVAGRLHAARNGVEVSGSPIQPLNPGGAITAFPQTNREQIDHTLNFQLPTAWLAAGTLTLWADVNPNRTLVETNFNDNESARIPLTLVSVPPMEIVLIPVAYRKNGQGPTFRPTLNQENKLGLGMLEQLFPVSEIRTRIHAEYYFGGDLNTHEGWGQLLHELTMLRQQERPNEALFEANVFPKYYGLIPPEGAYWGGLAFLPGTTGMGLADYANIASHELGHNVGLLHVESSVCGANPGGTDPEYPYLNSSIGHVGVDPLNVAVIPDEYVDVMSYCGPVWISDYHYKKIIPVLQSATNRALWAAQTEADQTEQPALLISGRVAANGQTAQLNHVLPVTLTGALNAPSDGGYEVALIDSQGNVQRTLNFQPANMEVVSDTIPPSDFGFALPRIPDLATIEVRKAGVVLATLQASAKPEVTASITPDTANPKRLLVNWQVTNNTPVHVNLRYSPDGGQTWQIVALGQTQSPFTLDTTRIPGSSNGKIEVIASSATESAATILEIGAVVDKAPVVAILEQNLVEFAPNETIILLGTAVDYEDGTLSGTSLTWFGADGAVLGTGNTLILPNGFAVGTHPIRLQAKDQAGNSVETTIQVVIKAAGSGRVYLPLVLR